MTAKRWEIINEEFISYTGGTAQLISNGECEIHLWETPKDAQLFCDKLNAINEENEQLKQQRIDLLRLIGNNIEIYENINTNVEFHKGEIQGKLTLLYNLRELIYNDCEKI